MINLYKNFYGTLGLVLTHLNLGLNFKYRKPVERLNSKEAKEESLAWHLKYPSQTYVPFFVINVSELMTHRRSGENFVFRLKVSSSIGFLSCMLLHSLFTRSQISASIHRVSVIFCGSVRLEKGAATISA